MAAFDRDLVGVPIEELDTPVLLLNGPACERNLQKMADFFRGRACQLRPHFKNHKCVTLARKQLAAGSAIGMTCAKLGEAEILADAGFPDLLIANQVVGARKVARLAECAKKTNLAVAIDDPGQADAISAAAVAAGSTVGLLVEVDGGMGRCGVQPGEPALRLAEHASRLPGVRFAGIQCYEGQAVYIDDRAERFRLAREGMTLAIETRRLIESRGIPFGVISGGASSTYSVTGLLEGVDELQCGTYATMDWRYHQLVPEFEIALSVLARVISKQPGKAVIDLGVKGAGGEFGVLQIKGRPDIEAPFFKAEEHCVFRGDIPWQVGDAIEVIPSHACTTCNLHRQFLVHDGQKVIDIWPIEASGMLA